MPEPLLTWITRLADDERQFDAALQDRSVLVYEPPAPEREGSSGGYRFRTASGIRPAVVSGDEPVVVVLAKSKDNVMQRRVTVGRTSNNDVVLEDASVSRFHAWFQQDETTGHWSIVDAGSKNGTQVASQRIPPKKSVSLQSGQRVKIGSLELTFYSAPAFKKMLESRGRVA